MKKRTRRILAAVILLLLLLAAAFALYVSDYYRAGPTAEAALLSDETVAVSETGYGWLFDGPSDKAALIFYPGGKVEAAAYAPLLRRLAAEGMDACLVEMPFRLAVFGANRAEAVMAAHDYERWYIGGHSLGGAMAASWASGHGGEIDGLVLLAAYPTKPLDSGLTEVLLCGSEDRIIDPKKIEEGEKFAPEALTEHVIEGGNHAQFGDYGPQKGDGDALVSADDQQAEAVAVILAQTEGRTDGFA